MKIEKNSLLEQQIQNDQPFAKAKVSVSFSETVKTKTDRLDSSVRTKQAGYEKEDLKKSAVEEFQEKMSGQMSAADRKNQMAVLSNTLTPEDYKKAQEEGFSLHSRTAEPLLPLPMKSKRSWQKPA